MNLFFFIITLFIISPTFTSAATFTLINKCTHTIWPGILGNAKLTTTGFQLNPDETRSIQIPPSWSGRFWARTGCTSDPTTTRFTCQTADCGSNQVECNGLSAAPPATLAEFTTGSGSGTQDYYDVSLVDGYNLPMVVEPSGGSGNCMSTGCASDLNQKCPVELRVGSGDGCKSACGAFGSPEYCCSGAYGTPDVCKPSMYSEIFKSVCPKAYSYAYDDATSTFTCTGADYTITFCPSKSGQKLKPNAANGTVSGGTGNDQSVGDNSGQWLPTFLFGDSTRNFSSSVFHCTWIVSLFSFVLLTYVR